MPVVRRTSPADMCEDDILTVEYFSEYDDTARTTFTGRLRRADNLFVEGSALCMEAVGVVIVVIDNEIRAYALDTGPMRILDAPTCFEATARIESIDEPRGLGAVVITDEDTRYTRIGNDLWAQEGITSHVRWELIAPRVEEVLSPGVVRSRSIRG